MSFWAAGGFDVENWEALRLLNFWRWAGLLFPPKMKFPQMLERPKSIFRRSFWERADVVWNPKKEVVRVEKEEFQGTM